MVVWVDSMFFDPSWRSLGPHAWTRLSLSAGVVAERAGVVVRAARIDCMAPAWVKVVWVAARAGFTLQGLAALVGTPAVYEVFETYLLIVRDDPELISALWTAALMGVEPVVLMAMIEDVGARRG